MHTCIRTQVSSAFPVQSGFTLYELLTTMAIVSVLTAAAIPFLQSLIAKERQNTAMNAFIAALYLTRSEALKRRERIVLCPSRNGENCDGTGSGGTIWHEGYLVFVDVNASRDRDAEEEIVHVVGKYRGLRIASSSGRDHVTYLPSGLARGTNATFRFCVERDVVPARSLVLSNSGRVRVAPRSVPTAPCPE